MSGAQLTASAASRFARHTLLPGWDQARLAAATAIVMGVGALGNAVAQNLALAGIGRLILCDPDIVDPSNLARAPLFRSHHIGRPKVFAAAETLSGLAPGTAVEARPRRLEHGVGLAELRDAAIVLGCLDSRWSRLELAGRCGLVRAPWIDGATGPWDGEVRLYLDPDGPCYGCGQPAEGHAVEDRPVSCGMPAADGGPAGAAAPLSAAIGAHMALAAVRHVMGLPAGEAGTILDLDGTRGTMRPVQQDRDPSCRFHRPIGAARRIAVSHTDTVGALCAALGPGAAPLAFMPVVTLATCLSCGFRDDTPAAADAPPQCPSCGATLRRRTTLELGAIRHDAVLDDLGIPPKEILAVRQPDGLAFVELGGPAE